MSRPFWVRLGNRFWFTVSGLVLLLSAASLGAETRAFPGPVSAVLVSGHSVCFVSPQGLFERSGGRTKLLLNPSSVRLIGGALIETKPRRTFALVGGVPGESGNFGLFQEGEADTPVTRLADDLIYDVAFDSNSQSLALACADGRVLLGQLVGGEVTNVSTRYRHTSAVRSVVFAPNGERLASAALDGLVLVADPGSDAEPTVIQDHSDKVECVRFSPDSMRILSGSRDGKLRLHSVDGRLIRTFAKWGALEGARPWGLSNQILSLSFAIDPQTVIVGSSQGYVFALSLKSGESSILERFSGPVRSVEWGTSLFVGADRFYQIDASLLSNWNRRID